MALNTNDFPFICFFDRGDVGIGDQDFDKLKLAVCDDPTCENPVILTIDVHTDWHSAIGSRSLVLDEAGYPIISFYDNLSGDLKLAYFDIPPIQNIFLPLTIHQQVDLQRVIH